jgi:hypothetical protein
VSPPLQQGRPGFAASSVRLAERDDPIAPHAPQSIDLPPVMALIFYGKYYIINVNNLKNHQPKTGEKKL